MSTTKFKGKTVQLAGQVPEVNDKAEDFTFVKQDLSEGSLADYDGKIKVIIALPSLDTGVCQAEARAFNEKIGKMDGVVGLIVSKDLPMAMKRFCTAEGIEDIIPASDFRYNDFANEYNAEMVDGPLKGLLARIVFVVDQENVIRFKEEVEDVTKEPNYNACLAALAAL